MLLNSSLLKMINEFVFLVTFPIFERSVDLGSPLSLYKSDIMSNSKLYCASSVLVLVLVLASMRHDYFRQIP